MTDKEITTRIAEYLFKDSGPDRFAIQLFVERVAMPESVKEYSFEQLKSYIRDALKRGTDHWEICSPADTQVSSFADNEEIR